MARLDGISGQSNNPEAAVSDGISKQREVQRASDALHPCRGSGVARLQSGADPFSAELGVRVEVSITAVLVCRRLYITPLGVQDSNDQAGKREVPGTGDRARER